MKKAATPIPIIRGIVDRRVNKPSINRMEQTTSANTIMPSDKLEPTPNGSGNTVLRYSKFCNFGKPCVGNKAKSDTHQPKEKRLSFD